MSASQLGLLLWKNYLHQKRQKVVTLFEIVLPALFTAVLLLIRQEFDSVPHPSGDVYMPFQPNMIPFWPNIIFYAPDTPTSQIVMKRAAELIYSCDIAKSYIKQQSCNKTHVEVKGFPSEEKLLKFATTELENHNPSNLLGAVIFTTDVLNASRIEYKIRLSDTTRNPSGAQQSGTTYKPMENEIGWNTELVYPLIQRPGPRAAGDSFGGAPGYFYEGFLAIQYGVDASLIELRANKTKAMDDVLVGMYRYPYPRYTDNQFVVVIETNLPVIIMLGYILAVLNITRNIVLEKENRLKSFMKIMGLKNWTHWLAHFIWNFFFLFLTNIIICVILTVDFNGKGAVLAASEPSILFLYLTVYSITAITFCLAVSAFSTRGNVAAAAAGMLWFATYMPYFFLQAKYDSLSFAAKAGSSFVVNTGMALGGQIIGMFEGTGDGVQYSSLNKAAVVDDNFTLAHVMVIMMADSILFLLVAWYVESVWPGDDQISLRWYFPFTKSYWKGFLPDSMQSKNFMPIRPTASKLGQDESCFEAEPVHLKPVIRVIGNEAPVNSGYAIDRGTFRTIENKFHVVSAELDVMN